MSAYVAAVLWAAMAAITTAAFVDLGDPVFAALSVFFALISQIVSRVASVTAPASKGEDC